MASELAPIDIRQLPELAAAVEEVQLTRRPRRIVRDGEDIARLVPVSRPRSRRRGRRTSAADPLWTLVGMVTTYDGPTDVSENVDRYLADAYAPTSA